MKCLLFVGATLLSVAFAQNQKYTTPVPILKQINRHNEDGSYSYGYEAADGTFKIETKYPDGQVYGKYGYVDDTGKLREVEYGASRRGFEPQGNDINVAPPTLKAKEEYVAPLRPGDEDDGQYREDPGVYYKDEAYSRPAYQQQTYQQPAYKQPAYQEPAYEPQPRPQPVYRPQTFQEPTYREPAPRPQPAFRPQSSALDDFENFRSSLGFSRPKAVPAPAPAPTPAPAYNNYNTGYRSNNYDTGSNNYNPGFSNQPAHIPHDPLPYNVDLNTGSYSLNVGR